MTQGTPEEPNAQAVEKKKPEPARFSITMDHVEGYEFRVKFDKEQFGELLMDEPPPLGGDRAPNASRLLAAAVGNCLSASLLFCAKKARVDIEGIHTEVSVEMSRNEQGRIRIGRIEVGITPDLGEADPQKAERCLSVFEDYCVVTQSVRAGIDVSVKVNR
jgi:uncharacterized OsmC-like protein